VTRSDRPSSGGEWIGLEGGHAADPRPVAARRGELVFQPLLSNLQVPRPRVDVVPRRSLVTSLLHSSAPLVVVSAPAGSGKTLALVQWVQAAECPCAWLQLDTSANDPVVLLTYLGLALGSVASVDPGVFDRLQESITPVRTHILPALEVTLAGARPFLLVLDDAHLVRSKACWEILSLRAVLRMGADQWREDRSHRGLDRLVLVLSAPVDRAGSCRRAPVASTDRIGKAGQQTTRRRR
jgi:hypothetical protein